MIMIYILAFANFIIFQIVYTEPMLLFLKRYKKVPFFFFQNKVAFSLALVMFSHWMETLGN